MKIKSPLFIPIISLLLLLLLFSSCLLGDDIDTLRAKARGIIEVDVKDNITLKTINSITLTPIEAAGYTERKAAFKIEVRGFLKDSHADNIKLTYPAFNGLTFSDDGGNISNGVKTFIVTLEYEFINEFPEILLPPVTITGLPENAYNNITDGKYTAAINIYIYDGWTEERAIPLNKVNIKYFNIYTTIDATRDIGLRLHYKLTENIIAGDLHTDLGVDNNWAAIGQSGTPFTGSFDGQGFTITGLKIKKTNSDYQGIFGNIGGSSAVVKNLGINVDITALSAGGIAGTNYGTIQNCYVG